MLPTLVTALLAGTVAGLVLFRRRGVTEPVTTQERWMPEPVDVPSRRQLERLGAGTPPVAVDAAPEEPGDDAAPDVDAWAAIEQGLTAGGGGDAPSAAVLGEVKGLGQARVEAIAAAFPTVASLRDAGVDGLVTVKGVGPAMAARILEAAG